MQENILEQGMDLLIYGMGTVFVFLAVLVLATTMMSALVQRYFSAPMPEPIRDVPNGAITDPKLLAVIKAAIKEHKKQ